MSVCAALRCRAAERLDPEEEITMNDEPISLVRAANAELARFLSDVEDFFPVDGDVTARLGEIESRLAALMALIQQVARAPVSSENPQGEAGDEMRQYRARLEDLRDFMMKLEAYAQGRRDQLLAGNRQFSEALAWCNAFKLTTTR